MKTWLTTQLLTAGMIVGSILQPTPSEAQSHRNVYSCIEKNGVPLTVVDTARGRVELIAWKSDYFRASKWTPQARCEEVSSRFQKFSDSKILKHVTTGTMNNYPVICVGQSRPPQPPVCIGDSLLITLQVGEDPNAVLESLFKQAAGVGGSAAPVSRDPEGKYSFDIENYLANYPYAESSANTTNPVQETLETQANPQPVQKVTPVTQVDEVDPEPCPPLFCDN